MAASASRTCLFAGRGCLSLSSGEEADLSLYKRGGSQDATPLLDDGVPELSAEISLYHWTASRAAASRWKPASHACAPRDRRASLWHAQDADGSNTLSNEAPAEGCYRDGSARARLQSHTGDEYHWCASARSSDQDMPRTLLQTAGVRIGGLSKELSVPTGHPGPASQLTIRAQAAPVVVQRNPIPPLPSTSPAFSHGLDP